MQHKSKRNKHGIKAPLCITIPAANAAKNAAPQPKKFGCGASMNLAALPTCTTTTCAANAASMMHQKPQSLQKMLWQKLRNPCQWWRLKSHCLAPSLQMLPWCEPKRNALWFKSSQRHNHASLATFWNPSQVKWHSAFGRTAFTKELLGIKQEKKSVD